MSTQYRKAVRSRLCQHCDHLDQAIREISTLAECEHPAWGEPGAEAAHEAALQIVRGQKACPKEALTPQVLNEIRRNARVSAGLPWTNAPNNHRSGDPIERPRSLQPSSLELAKQENIATYHEPSPEDVALPDDEDEGCLLLQESPATASITTSNSSTTTTSCFPCKTITTRSLAALMRRYDRCAITPAALEQLQALRDIALKQIAQIDAAQRTFRAKLRERNARRWRRSYWRPEHERGGVGGKREALALARGMGSPLSFYTAVEDADDPWGQRDARCERERGRGLGNPRLWVPTECGAPRGGEAEW
ncbi:hypothetical protein SLS62_007879 [Diatrype stigma]|uniref:Uncharacterized protein n=1 Tax=Diatrype stigma TaxID=117547 RepID=A0AAN9UKW8_9PEZI